MLINYDLYPTVFSDKKNIFTRMKLTGTIHVRCAFAILLRIMMISVLSIGLTPSVIYCIVYILPAAILQLQWNKFNSVFIK